MTLSRERKKPSPNTTGEPGLLTWKMLHILVQKIWTLLVRRGLLWPVLFWAEWGNGLRQQVAAGWKLPSCVPTRSAPWPFHSLRVVGLTYPEGNAGSCPFAGAENPVGSRAQYEGGSGEGSTVEVLCLRQQNALRGHSPDSQTRRHLSHHLLRDPVRTTSNWKHSGCETQKRNFSKLHPAFPLSCVPSRPVGFRIGNAESCRMLPFLKPAGIYPSFSPTVLKL